MIKDILGFRNELDKINEWWITKRVKEAERFPERREAFQKVEDELDTRRAIVILGPRRVGKSVLMKQIISALIKDGTNPRNIIYYSLDDPTLLTYCDNLIKDPIDYFLENITDKGKKYVFFDEIHLYTGWYRWIKAYYDKYLDIKFVLSGSSSLALQKEANKHLRGRTVEIEMYTLSFREFLKIYGIEAEKFDLETIEKFDEFRIKELWHKVGDAFKEYLLVGGFPEWFELREKSDAIDKWFKRLIDDVPKKAIYEDIVNIFGIKSPKIIELIFTFIAANQSRVIAYETINDVVKLDRATLTNYLEYLKNSYLIVEILKFANLKEQLKAKKKFLVIDQGLRNAILKDYELKESNVGLIIENLVGTNLFFYVKRKGGNLFYWKINNEVDFVIRNKSLIPVEVKYRAHIDKKDLKNLLNFAEKFNCKKGVLITKDLFMKEKISKVEILFVPAWLFLLACS